MLLIKKRNKLKIPLSLQQPQNQCQKIWETLKVIRLIRRKKGQRKMNKNLKKKRMTKLKNLIPTLKKIGISIEPLKKNAN